MVHVFTLWNYFSTWKLLMWAYMAVCFGRVLWLSWLHMHQLCEKFGKEVCSAASSAYLCLRSGSSNAGIISVWGAESLLTDRMYCYCLLAIPDTNCYHVVCRAFISVQIKKTWGCSEWPPSVLSPVCVAFRPRNFGCPLLVGDPSFLSCVTSVVPVLQNTQGSGCNTHQSSLKAENKRGVFCRQRRMRLLKFKVFQFVCEQKMNVHLT